MADRDVGVLDATSPARLFRVLDAQLYV